jgi:hypothetical protein
MAWYDRFAAMTTLVDKLVPDELWCSRQLAVRWDRGSDRGWTRVATSPQPGRDDSDQDLAGKESVIAGSWWPALTTHAAAAAKYCSGIAGLTYARTEILRLPAVSLTRTIDFTCIQGAMRQ